MNKPATYTGIRQRTLKACLCLAYAQATSQEKVDQSLLIAKMWKHHRSEEYNGPDDIDIASECADHVLAGIDTTSDTLMFLIWSFSRPEHEEFQDQLIKEVRSFPRKTSTVMDSQCEA